MLLSKVNDSSLCFFVCFVLFCVCTGNEGMREKHNAARSCLCEHCDVMCTLAYSTLEPFFEKCMSGSITLEEIDMVKQNKDRVLNLYSACNTGSDGDALKTKVELCVNHACIFQKTRGTLALLGEHLQRCKVSIEGR